MADCVEGNVKSTVLIVEDDPPTCALWTRHLEHWGWHVTSVPSAEEAEVIIDDQPPQAIILDVMLSDEKSGWDLLTRLRANRDTKTLPVFIVSAVEEPARAKQLGATGFMLKPCSANALAARIAEALVLSDEEEDLTPLPGSFSSVNQESLGGDGSQDSLAPM
jgi:DNA-binding response OmpR family regulator